MIKDNASKASFNRSGTGICRLSPPRKQRLGITLAAFVLAAAGVRAAEDDVFDLSLVELLDMKVTSVSKRAQRVAEAPAAVFVITDEDIRRSGVTNIPEALRMAPGVEVAQVDANKWAITARGFQSRFSNKLQVLLDGRTLYSPTYAGVFWDVQDLMLEDVDRIEVIRGPGATLWGANAVNGVINIITKDTASTTGALASVGAGSQDRLQLAYRYGGQLGSRGHYRVYARHFDVESNQLAEDGGDAGDATRQSRIGFKSNLNLSQQHSLTLQGDVYTGRSGDTVRTLSIDPPYYGAEADSQSVDGYNTLARWDARISEDDTLSVQMFFERARREAFFANLDRHTTDVDVDYRHAGFARHDLLLGMNYRHTSDHLGDAQRSSWDPQSREEEIFGAFIQDEITLLPETLFLTAGWKLEKNDFTGLEHQPNLRLRWTPDSKTMLWGSVTRAVRTPGRADRDSTVLLGLLEPSAANLPIPALFYANGNRDFQAENLLAWEGGLKHEFNKRFSADLAIYFNEYDDLRTVTPSGISCLPEGELPFCLFDPQVQLLRQDTMQGNGAKVSSHGIEIAATWQPSNTTHLKFAYSRVDTDDDLAPGTSNPEIENQPTRNNVSLRAGHQPTSNIDLDIWLRYADKVSTVRPGEFEPAYTTMDLRVAWRPGAKTEIALIGRNLLDSARVQFYSELGDIARTAIRRSVRLQLTHRF